METNPSSAVCTLLRRGDKLERESELLPPSRARRRARAKSGALVAERGRNGSPEEPIYPDLELSDCFRERLRLDTAANGGGEDRKEDVPNSSIQPFGLFPATILSS